MAGEADERKRFISATAANYFGLDPAAGALAAGLRSLPELSNFLDDGNEFLLAVQRSGPRLAASNQVRPRPAWGRERPVAGPGGIFLPRMPVLVSVPAARAAGPRVCGGRRVSGVVCWLVGCARADPWFQCAV